MPGRAESDESEGDSDDDSDGSDFENGSLKCTTAGASLRWLKKSKFLTTTVVKVFIYLLFIILILPILVLFLFLIFYFTFALSHDVGESQINIDGGRTNWRFRPWVNDDVAIEACDL